MQEEGLLLRPQLYNPTKYAKIDAQLYNTVGLLVYL